MKEFVEKLIERLEENVKSCEISMKFKFAYNRDYQYVDGKRVAFNECVEIVNKLVEEYNQDSTTIIETVRSNRLDCEVPSDYFEQITEVRVIDELTEETKVFNQDSTKKNQWGSNKNMTLDEAIKHAEETAQKKYTEGMLCHANPNDDLLDKCIECAKEHEQLAEWLRELKTLKYSGGWIPVTERLPEIGENEFYPDVIITDKNGVVEIAIYNEQDEEWYVMDIYSEEYEVKKDVVAWQPLLDPYKPEEKPKFSNEELDRIMDKILDTTQEETNFYAERFNRVL